MIKNKRIKKLTTFLIICGHSLLFSLIARAEPKESSTVRSNETTNILQSLFEENLKESYKAYDLYAQRLHDAEQNIIKAINEKINKLNDPQVHSVYSISERAQVITKLLSEISAIKDGRLDQKVREHYAIKNARCNEFADLLFSVDLIKDDVFYGNTNYKKISFKANARASSEYDSSYVANNCVDDDPQTEWALRGPQGKLSISINPPQAVNAVFFVSRRFHNDPVYKGEILINKTIKIHVNDFYTKDVMCIKFKESVAISSIDYSIISGSANPGLNEIILSVE